MKFLKEVVVIFRGKIRRKRLLGRLVNNMLHIPGYLVQRFGKIDVPAERFGEPLDAGGEFMVAGIEDNDGGVTDQGEDGPVVAVRDDSLEAGEIIKGGMEYFLSVRNDFAGRNIDGSVRLLRCDKLFQFPAELLRVQSGWELRMSAVACAWESS